jgi:hypothetical protein
MKDLRIEKRQWLDALMELSDCWWLEAMAAQGR